MLKKKQPYESPEISATRVELESSICTGSAVDIENTGETGIDAQAINNDFGTANGEINNNAFSSDSWNEVNN